MRYTVWILHHDETSGDPAFDEWVKVFSSESKPEASAKANTYGEKHVVQLRDPENNVVWTNNQK